MHSEHACDATAMKNRYRIALRHTWGELDKHNVFVTPIGSSGGNTLSDLSCYLVTLKVQGEFRNILFDAGSFDSNVAQTHFDKVREKLPDAKHAMLDTICVSHLHLDHVKALLVSEVKDTVSEQDSGIESFVGDSTALFYTDSPARVPGPPLREKLRNRTLAINDNTIATYCTQPRSSHRTHLLPYLDAIPLVHHNYTSVNDACLVGDDTCSRICTAGVCHNSFGFILNAEDAVVAYLGDFQISTNNANADGEKQFLRFVDRLVKIQKKDESRPLIVFMECAVPQSKCAFTAGHLCPDHFVSCLKKIETAWTFAQITTFVTHLKPSIDVNLGYVFAPVLTIAEEIVERVNRHEARAGHPVNQTRIYFPIKGCAYVTVGTLKALIEDPHPERLKLTEFWSVDKGSKMLRMKCVTRDDGKLPLHALLPLPGFFDLVVQGKLAGIAVTKQQGAYINMLCEKDTYWAEFFKLTNTTLWKLVD